MLVRDQTTDHVMSLYRASDSLPVYPKSELTVCWVDEKSLTSERLPHVRCMANTKLFLLTVCAALLLHMRLSFTFCRVDLQFSGNGIDKSNPRLHPENDNMPSCRSARVSGCVLSSPPGIVHKRAAAWYSI